MSTISTNAIQSVAATLDLGVQGSVKAKMNADNTFSSVIPGFGNNQYPDYACRAWVNFAGSGANGSQAIRASGNVSSVSRTAASTYQINFATLLPDANYNIVEMCSRDGITSTQNANLEPAPTSSSFVVHTRTGGATAVDPTYIMLSVFR